MKKLPLSFIAALLIPSILLISCSASQHAGITYQTKPPMEETNEAIWLSYWQDQFDAFKGNVVMPSAGEYNQSAVNAYQRSKMEWDEKVEMAKTNSSLILWGSIIGVSVLLLVIAVGSASPR